MEKFTAKLPTRQESIPVFSLIVFMVFSWTLYRMFWYVPSWLEYLSIGNVLVTAAYVSSFALLESAIVFGFICGLSLIFPQKMFMQRFVAQGCMIAGILGVGAFLIQRKMKLIYRLSFPELLVYPIIILVCVFILVIILAYLFRQFEFLPRLIAAIADRMTLFVYLYVPLGLVGFIIVFLRNVF